MTLVLEPRLENEVRQKAAERGQDADAYLQQLIQAALRQPVPAIIQSTLTTEEFLKSSQERRERANARNLPVSTSDFRREDIYDDEEGR